MAVKNIYRPGTWTIQEGMVRYTGQNDDAWKITGVKFETKYVSNIELMYAEADKGYKNGKKKKWNDKIAYETQINAGIWR